MLRQPLENGKVTISRAHSTVSYPAKFIFIAAMNPCPCGYLGSDQRYCTCSPNQVINYQNRVSGPVRDRIDVLLSLRPVQLKEPNFEKIESSETVRKRVSVARSRQYERYGEEVTNGEVVYERLLKTSRLNDRQHDLLQDLCMKYGLSNRVHIKVLRIARTIADLNGDDEITDEAILEALRLRKVEVDEGLRVSGGLRGGYDG